MEFIVEKRKIPSREAIKFFIKDNDKEVGYAFLYFIYNQSHDYHYGLLEDVFVDESYRVNGLGTKLVMAVIEEAKNNNCKYIMGTSRYSRPHVHKWYEKIGFKDYGKKFRMDF